MLAFQSSLCLSTNRHDSLSFLQPISLFCNFHFQSMATHLQTTHMEHYWTLFFCKNIKIHLRKSCVDLFSVGAEILKHSRGLFRARISKENILKLTRINHSCMNKHKNNGSLDKEIVLGNNDENNSNSLSMTFDATDDLLENDISTLIDLTTPSSFSFLPNHNQYINQTSNQEHFDNIPSLSNLISLEDWSDMSSSLVPRVGSTPIQTGYEDECRIPSYSIQLMRTSMDPITAPYLTYGSLSRPQFSHQDSEVQGVNNGGLVLPECLPRVSNNDLQAPSGEGQHLVHGSASSGVEISNLEDPTCKVGKLSVEERKLKIFRYKQKRNERNFSKKIKYACRKTLADTRPRVRGRFAKNDEHGEITRTNGSNHEYDDTDEDLNLYSNVLPRQCEVGMKEEDLDSSDIFAHISGLNSFKCSSYPIQSWI